MVPGRERFRGGDVWEGSRLGKGMIEKRKAWEMEGLRGRGDGEVGGRKGARLQQIRGGINLLKLCHMFKRILNVTS